MSSPVDVPLLVEQLGVMFNEKLHVYKDKILDSARLEREPMQNDVENLKRKNEYYESLFKRRNFIMYGVHEHQQETFEDLRKSLLHIFNVVMQSDVTFLEIDNCYRLGKRNKNCRPILVKCLTEWRKNEMMNRQHLLKRTGIYLEHDLTKEQIQRRRENIFQMKEFRNQGRHAVVRKDKLIVNGALWNESQSPVLNMSIQESASTQKHVKNKEPVTTGRKCNDSEEHDEHWDQKEKNKKNTLNNKKIKKKKSKTKRRAHK